MMRTYVTMLRVVFDARSDLHATATSEWFREHVESTLEPNDNVDVTQTLLYGEARVPDEQVNHLKRARNELIRLKFRDTMDLAQALDRIIVKLEARVSDDDDVVPDYDWNRIYTLSELIAKGQEPLI